MSLLSLSESSKEVASDLLKMLTLRYPHLHDELVSSSRLIEALESVTEHSDLDPIAIFDALTARELTTAQRPIGVLVSRCAEIIGVAIPSETDLETISAHNDNKPAFDDIASDLVTRLEDVVSATRVPDVDAVTSKAEPVRATSFPPDRIVIDKSFFRKHQDTTVSVADRRLMAQELERSRALSQSAMPIEPAPTYESTEPVLDATSRPVDASDRIETSGSSALGSDSGSNEAVVDSVVPNDIVADSVVTEINGEVFAEIDAVEVPIGEVVERSQTSRIKSARTSRKSTKAPKQTSRKRARSSEEAVMPAPQAPNQPGDSVETTEIKSVRTDQPTDRPTDGTAFLPELAKTPGKAVPHRGVRRWLYACTFGFANFGPGKKERRDIELFQKITSPIVGARNIVVLGLKGGVGKTTVSLALGHTFAMFRNDRVVALDASPDPSTLNQRIENIGGGSVRELAAQRKAISSYVDLQKFAAQQSTGLEVLASDRLPQSNTTLTSKDFDGAVECLSSYFNLIITDSGSGTALSSLDAVLKAADQLVIVTAPMVDAGWSAGLLLDWLESNGHASLAAESTIVVNQLQRRVHVEATSFDAYFKNRCRNLVRIPWDSSLAAGGLVSIDLLHTKTRDAFQNLAATVAIAAPPAKPAAFQARRI
jgi:MinD-like ATPase involved in chromosome partitioning or flagellar assembly